MTVNPQDRLDSWKEIATFLNRGVRTVQRWEAIEGLPVYSEVGGSGVVEVARRGPYARKPCAAKDLSADPTQEYLADGFTEEMITQLARLQPDRLAVIARATAMHYKGTRKRVDRIARELKVDYLLEGSLREGSEVRVTAQLIEASDQTHRWAQTYDRDLASALVLQNEVASAIANEIHLALSPEAKATLTAPRSIDAGAHEDYLRGRYHLNRPHPKAHNR